MIDRTAFAAAIALLGAGCASDGQAQPHTEICGTSPAYAGAPVRKPLDSNAIPGPAGLTAHAGDLNIEALDRAFDRAFEATGAVSMTAALHTADDTWMAERGAPAGALHYWASVGKIITAAAILQLDQQGRLSLDQTIAEYVSDVPNGDLIALRMLLNHTSGLFSANEDELVRERSTPLSLEEELAVLNRRGPYACPGVAWRYSNSGYALLGAVIEQVTGKPYAEAAQELVLSRSHASAIRILSRTDGLDDVAPLQGSTAFDIRGPQAAGGAVASAEAMAVFLTDLLAGRILPPDAVETMFGTLYPMQQDGLWYGLGLMVFDVPGPDDDAVWIGHSGGVPGAKAVVAYDHARSAAVAVALTGDGSAEASANLILRQLGAAE